MIAHHEELDTAARLARAAGVAAMRHYGRAASIEKADASPVSHADYAANHVILEGLRSAYPADAIRSEESEDTRPAANGGGRVWIVDPLDGTREFLAQNGEFSVLVGLVVEGTPMVGAVYLPGCDALYGAARGHGAWVERRGRREPLACAPADPRALRLIGSRSHADPLLESMRRALGIRDVVPCGSIGVKCARLAEGECDLYIHPVGFLKEWDTCAPEVLLREAGGSVTDCLGRPLAYGKPDPVQPDGILACGPGALEFVLERVPPLFSSARARRG
jgi:3'(2'), 5'-bisphosphate nucleotidase